MSDVKFVRINGRVVPLKGKGSAPSGVSKRYGAKREKPEIKKLGSMGKAAATSVGAAAGALAFRGGGLAKLAAGIGLGGLVGFQVGSTKITKRGKGESDKQLANRVSGNKKNKTGV